MTYGYIYSITCVLNGKVYVGQTTNDVDVRFRQHLSCAKHGYVMPIGRAIRKYGITSFNVKVLEECNSLDELNKAESKWIYALGAMGENGCNCNTGGDSYIVSDEHRKHLSDAHIGIQSGERNPFYGHKHDPETIAEMKRKLSERFSGEGNPFYGKTHPPEVMERIRQANIGKPMTDKARVALAKANKGNQYTKGRKIPTEQKEKSSKLTAEDVVYIKKHLGIVSQTELAKKFNVSWWTIHNILIGYTWKEVRTHE